MNNNEVASNAWLISDRATGETNSFKSRFVRMGGWEAAEFMFLKLPVAVTGLGIAGTKIAAVTIQTSKMGTAINTDGYTDLFLADGDFGSEIAGSLDRMKDTFSKRKKNDSDTTVSDEFDFVQRFVDIVTPSGMQYNKVYKTLGDTAKALLDDLVTQAKATGLNVSEAKVVVINKIKEATEAEIAVLRTVFDNLK